MKSDLQSTETLVALEQLQELIAALDRRVPQMERLGEIAIAREAAALKQRAIERIAALSAAVAAARA